MWVENRLSEIRKNIGVDCWHYVPTESNPADIATRCNKKVKFNEVLWFKGASFLTQEEKCWPTITHKIFETNPSFDVKERTTGKVSFLFFKPFPLVLTKLSFWQEDWALGYHSKKFRHFPDIS